MRPSTTLILGIVLVATSSMSAARVAVPTGCTWQGKHYPEGHSFSPDPCTSCQCSGGQAMCAVMDCMMPACVDMVHSPDQCCPTCPNGPNCRAPDGTIIPAGQEVKIDSSTTCRCEQSHFMMNSDAVCMVAVSR
ncbi:von Willebrand factor C domain-containing protein 2-like [Babylonia areolata]|uniref:von Willebrand factor C domain-containing protein 2-like n=1 Tax=Babylonia areolata TaxID=304850 RepID=UPI003FD375D5